MTANSWRFSSVAENSLGSVVPRTISITCRTPKVLEPRVRTTLQQDYVDGRRACQHRALCGMTPRCLPHIGKVMRVAQTQGRDILKADIACVPQNVGSSPTLASAPLQNIWMPPSGPRTMTLMRARALLYSSTFSTSYLRAIN